VRAEREHVDASQSLPFGEASFEVGFDTGRRLIALLGGLGEKLQDDCRDRGRDSLRSFAGLHGLSCDMAVNPLHGIGGGERQAARQHFIQRDAE